MPRWLLRLRWIRLSRVRLSLWLSRLPRLSRRERLWRRRLWRIGWPRLR